VRAPVITAPATIREKLRGSAAGELIDILARSLPVGELADPACAVRVTLRQLSRHCPRRNDEIAEADADRVRRSPGPQHACSPWPGVGPETAGQLLTTVGDNPDRLHPEALFVHLYDTAPLPAPPAAPTGTA
jgi:hypothetical protein